MTNFEIFKALVNRLLEKGILPKPDQRHETDDELQLDYNCSKFSNDFLDYVLFDDFDNTELKPDECIVHGDLNYGCEGIYLDLSIKTEDCKSFDFGTIKTLSDDRFAMHTMASLLADILVESWDLTNELA